MPAGFRSATHSFDSTTGLGQPPWSFASSQACFWSLVLPPFPTASSHIPALLTTLWLKGLGVAMYSRWSSFGNKDAVPTLASRVALWSGEPWVALVVSSMRRDMCPHLWMLLPIMGVYSFHADLPHYTTEPSQGTRTLSA